MYISFEEPRMGEFGPIFMGICVAIGIGAMYLFRSKHKRSKFQAVPPETKALRRRQVRPDYSSHLDHKPQSSVADSKPNSLLTAGRKK